MSYKPLTVQQPLLNTIRQIVVLQKLGSAVASSADVVQGALDQPWWSCFRQEKRLRKSFRGQSQMPENRWPLPIRPSALRIREVTKRVCVVVCGAFRLGIPVKCHLRHTGLLEGRMNLSSQSRFICLV